LAALLALWSTRCAPATSTSGAQAPAPTRDSLIVYHAGSLREVLQELADSFLHRHPGVGIRLQGGGSVSMARLGLAPKPSPDVYGMADYAIIPRVLMPSEAEWDGAFAGNAMVLVYTDRSQGAGDITSDNWPDILLQPGIRAGHSDPALDPGGYRARLVFALAERYYRRPGLAAALDRAVPTFGAFAAGQNPLDQLRAGELDYLIAYRTTARGPGLRYLPLPPTVDMSDPALAATYGAVGIWVANSPADSFEIRGEPVFYGVTVPRRAPHPRLAEAFVALLLSDVGHGVLERGGFTVPVHPRLEGSPPRSITRQ
jgi:molybdate/tungstate transport system substrate-binding protein